MVIWKMVSCSFLCFSSLVSLSKCFLSSFNPLSTNVSLNGLKVLIWGFTKDICVCIYINNLLVEPHETNLGNLILLNLSSLQIYAGSYPSLMDYASTSSLWKLEFFNLLYRRREF